MESQDEVRFGVGFVEMCRSHVMRTQRNLAEAVGAVILQLIKPGDEKSEPRIIDQLKELGITQAEAVVGLAHLESRHELQRLPAGSLVWWSRPGRSVPRLTA